MISKKYYLESQLKTVKELQCKVLLRPTAMDAMGLTTIKKKNSKKQPIWFYSRYVFFLSFKYQVLGFLDLKCVYCSCHYTQLYYLK